MNKLTKYNQKRNFDATSEPNGKVKQTKSHRFVVQHHLARKEHYDFRLEFDGVLVSFALPKGLPEKERHLAVHVEDHPVGYIDFEGIIPKGNYGAGSVEIFDKGTYEPLTPFRTGFKKGHIKFQLNGQKYNGVWSLIRTKEPNWLIVKSKEIQGSKEKHKVKNPFDFCDVKLASLSTIIPEKEYLYEIKYDGYRILSFIDKNVKLKTRNNKDYSQKFPSITESLRNLEHSMILDGEIVVFDKKGRSDFALLTDSIKAEKNDFCYVVFDILAIDGKDIRKEPLLTRKKILEKELASVPSNIILSNYALNNGKECFELAKKLGLEGIVAKKYDSVYNGYRDSDWLKIKCFLRQEFVVGGYSISDKRNEIGAIYVGYYQNKKFVFAGKVGTGFNKENRQELEKLFDKNKTTKCPFENFNEDIALWLKPKIVVEVQFMELTKNNLLRHPSFIGIRPDKNPNDVVLESKNAKN